jgi:hypothetical protein
MGGGRGRIIALAAVIALLLVAGVVAADRPRLRAAEAAYLDGRSLTACATARLRPFAESGRDLDELPGALDEIIADARQEAAQVHVTAGDLRRGILPATDRAVAAVRRAIDAQVALYDAMADDPTGSDDELRTLGVANNRAEARLDDARGWLAAGAPDGWDRRFTCRDQASSASSSK